MRKLYRRSASGRSTWAPLLIGLVSAWFLFRRSQTTSTTPRQTILNTLISLGVSPRTAEYWVAVSDHETGKWSSDLYTKYHNLFGMKQPLKRATLSKGPTKITENGNPFASFDSDSDSVKDLVLYMKEFHYPMDFSSVDALISFMKSKGYFSDTVERYLKSVKARL